MLTFSSQQFDIQWDRMSEKLRETLYSPAYAETVLQVAKDNHLDEFKAERVASFVGYIIFGLLHPEELNDELIKELNVPRDTAKSIANSIDTKIFSQFREELNEIYDPIPERALEPVLSTQQAEREITTAASDTKTVRQAARESSSSITSSGPKIIHQEERAPVSKTKTPRKSFILSPGIFKQGETIKEKGVVARVTTPKRGGGSRTVHYSELRTPVPGGMTGEGFIDLTKLGPASRGAVPYQDIPPQKDSKAVQQKKEQGPKLDGNTVDLRTP